MSPDSPLERLADWPRLPLANLPTPLREMPRLARELGAPELDLWVKMDAETGFALGGNKVRKLEFELAPDRTAGVTCLLTAGGPQSNHCRVTAAAAARLGLGCVLVLNGPEPDPATGNALLHRLFGAEIVTVDDRADRAGRLEEEAAAVKRGGGVPLPVPIGASTGLGCLGYARAAVELMGQLDACGPRPKRTVVFVPSSSCGTLAGLLLGLSLLGRDDVFLVGVSADASTEQIEADAERIALEGAELLGWSGTLNTGTMRGDAGQVGAGYGIPTEAAEAATHLFAASEGLVLDPTYTAKGAAGMVERIHSGGAGPPDRVVFLHTGGHPGLLA
jgi:1-aminocyclopropane-1-carboxylate deaminase/D-cysteine desulfhydrase-like pyridoxal-dependent ACC family enzyme